MWIAFIATFVLLRALTFAIRYHLLPVGNVVTSGGLHIHHFVWGILILLLSGFLGITVWSVRLHPWLATIFGIGAALVIDEFAEVRAAIKFVASREGQLLHRESTTK